MGMSLRADAAVPSCRDAYSLGGFSHHQRRPGLTNLRQHGKLADVLPVADARYLRGRQSRSVSAPDRASRLRTTSCQVQVAGAERAFSRCAEKALEINLESKWYGTLAEIGAGQEVARWFFRVGGAAGTIAKSVSAYDMTISDSMYGAAKRYVTRERLEAMLDYEFLQCNLTLRPQRGDRTAFFAFADTLTTKAFNRDNECHGWLGVKMQPNPRAEPSRVLVHIRMLDKNAQLQQEAVGVLGVNLIHASLKCAGNPSAIISALMDDLSRARIEVDLIDLVGPLYSGFDNRVAALRLVQKGLCDAALFDPSGGLQIPQETLYKKNVLLVRGRFRPFTLLHNDMLMGAASQFFCGPGGSMDGDAVSVTDSSEECVFREDTLVLLEMTTRDMMEGGDLLDWTSDSGIQEAAFIQRIEALSTMGYSVLLSNYRRYFKLAAYLSTFTKESIVIALGLPSLVELFKEKHYADLDGGILEGFGRLLKFDLKLYVYPTLDDRTGELITADNVKVEPTVQKLYDYILERGTIHGISVYNHELLLHGDVSKCVTESIRCGTDDWESLVPSYVRDQIKSMNLLGYRGPERRLGRSNTQMMDHAVVANGAGANGGAGGNGTPRGAQLGAPAKAA